MKYQLIALAALLALPLSAEAAKRTKRVSATAHRAGVVYPLLRVFAAVRKGGTARTVQIKAAPGKPNKNVTVRAYRVSTGQQVFSKTQIVSTTSAVSVKLPAFSGMYAGDNDKQSTTDQYIIQVTPAGKSASRSNTNILGKGIQACRSDDVKFFEGKVSVSSTGKGLALRPETDPWPDPEPTSSCVH